MNGKGRGRYFEVLEQIRRLFSTQKLLKALLSDSLGHVRAEALRAKGTMKDHDQPANPDGTQPGRRDIEKEQRARLPLVSVVIPCYKQAHFLGEAIESVLAQSHPRFEIIVVDDGSPDNTSEVARRYPGVRLVRQENQGLSGARNTGLRESKGSYVVFLDADDRLLPEALATGLECFEAHPECAFVYGHHRLIAVDGSLLAEWQPSSFQSSCIPKDHYAQLLQGNHIAMHATVMYRRGVFESVGEFDTSLSACEDYDLYLRISRDHPIQFHEQVVAEYRQHSANATCKSALMLPMAVRVLLRQRQHIGKSEHYKEAYETGKLFWHRLYGDPLVDEVRARVRERNWKRALRGALVLVRYYPLGLILLLLNEQNMQWHMERSKVVMRLRLRQQELHARERQLRLYKRRLAALKEQPAHHEREVEDLESTLAKERREVQWLRRRTRRLALQIQELDRRSRNGRKPKRRSTKQKHLKNVKAMRRKVRRKAQRWMAFVRAPSKRAILKRKGRARF